MIDYEAKLKEFMGMIYYLARKYKLRYYDKDDLIQEFSMLLIKCLDRYDETKKANFETFFTTYVRMWVHVELVRQNTQKRGEEVFILSQTYKMKGVPINYNVMDNIQEMNDLSPDEFDFQVTLYEFIDNALSKMPSGDYTKEFLFDGKTHSDIARENNVTASNINAINKRNIGRLRQLLQDNGYLDNLDKTLNRKIEEFRL